MSDPLTTADIIKNMGRRLQDLQEMLGRLQQVAKKNISIRDGAITTIGIARTMLRNMRKLDVVVLDEFRRVQKLLQENEGLVRDARAKLEDAQVKGKDATTTIAELSQRLLVLERELAEKEKQAAGAKVLTFPLRLPQPSGDPTSCPRIP